MEGVSLPVQLLSEGATAPAYTRVGDAGMDLRCTEAFTLAPFERACVPCGIAIALPPGYAGYVLPRSGLALKHGISVVNAPGLIDSNYRGEIKVVLINLDPVHEFHAERGERIAQLVVSEVAHAVPRVADALDDTNRGTAGFGSSGRV